MAGVAEDGNGTTTTSGMFSWAVAGVDFSLPGNGGWECVHFLSPTQRLLESGLASLLALFICYKAYPRTKSVHASDSQIWMSPVRACCLASLLALFICYKAYPRLTLPAGKPRVLSEGEAAGKSLLLVLMCLTWGCELGFKFATRQMIWIFNPCHVATAVQIYLLAAAPSKGVTAAFRLHMHILTGAPIAILFPVINTRLLPFETEVYYIQHILMLVIPFYLMHLGDPYVPERLGDFSWSAMTFGVAFLYHFIPLQILGIVTGVNLNNMLCPAVSDPFHGPFYRLFAIAHQSVLIPSLGKLYAALARKLGWCPENEEASVAELIKRPKSPAAKDKQKPFKAARTQSAGATDRKGSVKAGSAHSSTTTTHVRSSSWNYSIENVDSCEAEEELFADVSEVSKGEGEEVYRGLSSDSNPSDNNGVSSTSKDSGGDQTTKDSGVLDLKETAGTDVDSVSDVSVNGTEGVEKVHSWQEGLRNRDGSCLTRWGHSDEGERRNGNGHVKDH